MMGFLQKHKAVKVMLVILGILAAVLGTLLLYLRLDPVFGGKADTADRADYASRADNYKDGRFFYPEEYLLPGMSQDVRVSANAVAPAQPLPQATPQIPQEPAVDKVYVTWLGHSSLLVQMHGLNILIDPVYTQRASPLSFVGPQRYQASPLPLAQLPDIDLVLLSHDHYDHLDMDTIRALDEKTARFIVPLGMENHLTRWGVEERKITNMAWWEELEVEGLTVACTPARHYSGRMGLDAGSTLFCSWVLKDEYHQIFESGDSGFGSHFQAIHDKYGDFDLVMTDCAQYDIKWHASHMFPEESVQACGMLGAKLAMPIHWGAYVLSTHGWDDPVIRFTAAAERAGLPVAVPLQGATMDIDQPEGHREPWWLP